ncbi:MAG TPA: FHA domain-containing protein [Thermoanaerobaculia bacterium]|nr:FHA domain-containing protein [Thermoanaerobaculia bacterium]
MRVRFGDCIFDSETRELLRCGRVVHVSPKAFRLLELLIEARPRALSKTELAERLWPDTFVSEGNLAGLAAELRAAVGERARESGPIRTVYSYGYAFSAETVAEVQPGPVRSPTGRRHWLVWNKREIPLSEGENVLGRDVAAGVQIDETTVSRHHARIVVSGKESRLEDLGSKNGTFLAGKPVKKPARLSDGDEIKLGSVFLTFRTAASDESTDTVRER